MRVSLPALAKAMPTIFIWGENDIFARPRTAASSKRCCRISNSIGSTTPAIKSRPISRKLSPRSSTSTSLKRRPDAATLVLTGFAVKLDRRTIWRPNEGDTRRREAGGMGYVISRRVALAGMAAPPRCRACRRRARGRQAARRQSGRRGFWQRPARYRHAIRHLREARRRGRRDHLRRRRQDGAGGGRRRGRFLAESAAPTWRLSPRARPRSRSATICDIGGLHGDQRRQHNRRRAASMS